MTIRSPGHRPIRVGGRQRRFTPVHWILVASLLLNAFLLLTRPTSPDAPAPVEDVDPPTVVEDEPPAVGEVTPEEADTPAPEAAPVDDVEYVSVVIDGPVSRGFVKALGSPEGDRLALTVGRMLVWNLDLTKDPRPGDVCEVLYRVDPDDPVDIAILGLRYRSAKFDKSFEAWRFQPTGWTFPGWFDADGKEVAAFLQDGPIQEYEQITSLIGDGRGHSGMDFKTPIGTKVTAPFAGTVARTNWRTGYNGNCLELRAADGRVARFLHLSEIAEGLAPGSRVDEGALLALSGNTGRSFAPHLHYEMIGGSGRTLDPLDEHEVRHRVLSAADREGFVADRARLVERMDATDETGTGG